MARRRNRELDVAAGVAQLAMLLILACALIPSIRNGLLGLGVVMFGLAVLAGMIALGVVLIPRFVRANQRHIEVSAVPETASRSEPIPNAKPNTPHTTRDLIRQLRSMDWFQFEKIVALAYRKLGYGVTRRGGANPDGGIDLLIQKDGETQAVQCKHWKTWNVGVKAVREFLGALKDGNVHRGIFVTLGGYTGDARKLADKHGIGMLTETELAQMLETVDARFDPEVLELLSDQRKFCPRCESELVLRTANKGPHKGQQFMGCSNYPQCKFIFRGD
jgi:hypothetical protein